MSLAQKLADYGLHLRGAARLRADETERYQLDPARPMIALVGNIGSSYWPVFSESAEFHDGEDDPLDRWSRRVARAVADEFDLVPLYPFDGPPYLPFQQWAERAEGLQRSPLGITMHPEHGLWHSYRFALLGRDFAVAEPPRVASPCLDCADQPCLRRCPVDAFDGSGYDVPACSGYLFDTPLAECHALGCLARYACPISPELRYRPEQGRFHLQAFLAARRKDETEPANT